MSVRPIFPLEPTVFVVDDEPGIRNAIMLTLRRAGYPAYGFSDVQSLAEPLQRSQPFLVVLDVSLENSDAVEALQTLSDLDFRGAVQLLSGRPPRLLDDIRQIGERRKLRMLPVLEKPCRMQTIRSVADREASRWAERGSELERAPHRPTLGRPTPPSVSLHEALEECRVEVWYQPKIDLRTGALVGAECLSRVRQPCGGIVLPGSFLPGSSSATMERLTEVVLQQALEDWSEFLAAGIKLKLSVNIPSEMLGTYPLAALVRQCVPKSEHWPGLVLEVTEEDALRDVVRAGETATQLSIYGVELSIDDFGLGYSSLSRLQQIPFKEIKLDRSLVQECATDSVRGALCKAVVELAHTLGAVVVGEGVEATADLLHLRQAGCDMAQGYLLGRPMPKPDMISSAKALELNWSEQESLPRSGS